MTAIPNHYRHLQNMKNNVLPITCKQKSRVPVEHVTICPAAIS